MLSQVVRGQNIKGKIQLNSFRQGKDLGALGEGARVSCRVFARNQGDRQAVAET